MGKRKSLRTKYRTEWYYSCLPSALLIVEMFDSSFATYSTWKKILKNEKCPPTYEELVEYCVKLMKDKGIKEKLPENTHIVAVWTTLGPIFRVAIGDKVMPLEETGFEAPIVSKYYKKIEEVL